MCKTLPPVPYGHTPPTHTLSPSNNFGPKTPARPAGLPIPMISVGYAGRPFCPRQTLSAPFVHCAGHRPALSGISPSNSPAPARSTLYRVEVRKTECNVHAFIIEMRPRHDTIGSLTAARKLRHEFTPRPARSTNRPRFRISVRDAARELHDRSRAVLQWAEPRDAALHGDQPLGRALQGGQDARQVDLLPPQRECCGQTSPADRCAPFRRPRPHPARRDAIRTQPAARPLAARSARARQHDHADTDDEATCRAWAARQGFQLDVLDRDLPAFSDACRWIWARMSRGLISDDDLDRQACAAAQPDHGGKPCIRSFGMNMAGSFRWCGRKLAGGLGETEP